MQPIGERSWPILCLTGLLILPGVPSAAQQATQKTGNDQAQEEPSGRPLSLEDLEKIALHHNPTLAQAEAEIRAAEGRKKQAGLYPNPTIGYTSDEVSFGPIIRGGEHGFFVEQRIVTARKLGLSRNVFAQEQVQAEAQAEAQRYRVLNAVRVFYYRALGAQRLVEVQGQLVKIANEAVDISKQLFNVGQADHPDVLEVEIEAQRAEMALMAARNDQERVWRQLGSVVGDPALKLMPLAGKLDEDLPELDSQSALEAILSRSPELKVAQAEVERAEMALKRAKAEPTPDIVLRGGLRNNRELLELALTPVGLEGFVDVGVTIPLFNRNQGNVKAAVEEIVRAKRKVEWVRLSLRARFAPVFREYLNSLDAAHRYRKEMLPRAEQAYNLYLKRYRDMAAAYPQVLISQRTLFQLQESYVTNLVSLWDSAITIRGLLLVDGLAAVD